MALVVVVEQVASANLVRWMCLAVVQIWKKRQVEVDMVRAFRSVIQHRLFAFWTPRLHYVIAEIL